MQENIHCESNSYAISHLYSTVVHIPVFHAMETENVQKQLLSGVRKSENNGAGHETSGCEQQEASLLLDMNEDGRVPWTRAAVQLECKHLNGK